MNEYTYEDRIRAFCIDCGEVIASAPKKAKGVHGEVVYGFNEVSYFAEAHRKQFPGHRIDAECYKLRSDGAEVK